MKHDRTHNKFKQPYKTHNESENDINNDKTMEQ